MSWTWTSAPTWLLVSFFYSDPEMGGCRDLIKAGPSPSPSSAARSRGGDVVDALALGVPAGRVELPVEVLLRVAGHLRRRPRPHRETRDVTPVPAAVLLQPLKKQPANTQRKAAKTTR